MSTFGKIGAKSLLEHRKFPDSYVQDGLVAMWDGQWNAGWGKHDPNATVWKNLTGDSRLDLDITGMVIDKDSVDTNALVSKTESILPQTDFTIEVVGKTTVKSGNWAQIEYWLGYGSSESMPLGFGPSGSWLNQLFYRYGNTSGKSDTSSYDTGGKFSVINSWSGQSVIGGGRYFYKNGVQLANTSWVPRQGNFTMSDSNYLGIGIKLKRDNTIVTNANKMTLNTIRFYSRALSAEEVAENYAIDKARFNL